MENRRGVMEQKALFTLVIGIERPKYYYGMSQERSLPFKPAAGDEFAMGAIGVVVRDAVYDLWKDQWHVKLEVVVNKPRNGGEVDTLRQVLVEHGWKVAEPHAETTEKTGFRGE
jgi:hypothetical protein